MAFRGIALGAALFHIGLGISWVQASGPSGGKYRVNIIGEGGAHQTLGPGADGYMETNSRLQGGHGTHGPWPPASSVGKAEPAPLLPSAVTAKPQPAYVQTPMSDLLIRDNGPIKKNPRMIADPARAMLNKTRRQNIAESKFQPERYSLWEGLLEPLALPASMVDQMSQAQARNLGSQDYESHILGRRSPRTSEVWPSGSPALVKEGGASQAQRTRANEIFVSLELRSGPQQYRDALADVAHAIQFRQDFRFQPQFQPSASMGRTSVWGWMPADQIANALGLPHVAQLRIEKSASSGLFAPGSSSELVVGLRLPKTISVPGENGSPAAAVMILKELQARSGWVLKKTLGVQKIPGSSDMALVVIGQVPLKNLQRLMDHPAVIKLAPSPSRDLEPDEKRKSGDTGTFVNYVWQKFPFLYPVTLLMLLAPLRRSLARFVKIFIPYR